MNARHLGGRQRSMPKHGRLLGILGMLMMACSFSTSVTVEGIVVAVDGDLSTVRSFEVLTTEGDNLHFEPDPFGDFAFPLPHLGSHMRSLDPIRVAYRTTDDGVLLAVGIEDA